MQISEWFSRTKRFLTLLFFFVSAFGIQQALGWPVVRIWGASPWGYGISADLLSVLTAADCFKDAPVQAYLEAGAGSCQYIYGNFLIVALNFLALGASSTVALSWMFVVGISAAFAHLTNLAFSSVKSLSARVATLLALTSPPVALLLERANFDVLVFLISMIGLTLFRKTRFLAAAIAICGAALMKFYAILGLLIFAAARMKIWQKIVVSVISLLVIAEIAVEVLVRRPAVPMDIGGAFGSYSIGLWFNFSTEYLRIPLLLSNNASLAIGLIALLLGVLCSFRYLKKIQAIDTLTFDLTNPSSLEIFGAGMAPVFLGCYILGTNYDYRLIFLVPFALALLARSDEKKTRRLYLVLFLAAMWLSYNSGVIGQVIGDALMIIWASISALAIIRSSRAFMERVLRSRSSKNA